MVLMKLTQRLARMFRSKDDVPISTQANVPNWIVGGLYSAPSDKGGFRIAKILVIEQGIVHVRIYKNRFEKRPKAIDQMSLSLGTIHDPDGCGMGHMPVSQKTFAEWELAFVAQSSVKEEELEGYKYWQEHGGGGAF